MTPTLIVMVKEPRPGRVKTRLARDIGAIPATWWFRHQVTRLLRQIDDPRWRSVLAVAPDLAVTSRQFPAHLPRLPQGRGDLGQRMLRALRQTPGPTCLIGADIPGITRAHIAQGFAALGAHDAVFGPAEDGGYWLIGARHPTRLSLRALDGVRWSTPHALADSRACLSDLRLAQIARLRDVDQASDL